MPEKSISPKEARPPALRVVVGTRPVIFRELLCKALDAADLAVVGQGQTEEELAAALDAHAPPLLVFDYEALGPGGESAIQRLRTRHPETRVLVLATRSGPNTVESVLCAGASGLVGKEEGFAMLVRALRAVAAGEIWANRVATAQAFERLTAPRGEQARASGLTEREAAIVADVLRGLRNKEIARRLSISEKTVKSHLNNIFRKVGVDSRMSLAMFAMSQPEPKA